MPEVSRYGQLITFAIEDGGDQRFTGFRKIEITKWRRTISAICKQAGHPELAGYVKNLNGIRNPDTKLKIGRSITVPDNMRPSAHFSVLAGDTAPRVIAGYAKITTVERSERKSLSLFSGYEPITLEVPVRFEAEDNDGSFIGASGKKVESDISKLEEFAGIGAFRGSGTGSPPTVRVTTRSVDGETVVPLIPRAYQWTKNNPQAPVYWISGIDWDEGAIRNRDGDRIRQLATITLVQYVRPAVAAPSAATRHRVNQSQSAAHALQERQRAAEAQQRQAAAAR
jgi:hypothetical protein